MADLQKYLMYLRFWEKVASLVTYDIQMDISVPMMVTNYTSATVRYGGITTDRLLTVRYRRLFPKRRGNPYYAWTNVYQGRIGKWDIEADATPYRVAQYIEERIREVLHDTSLSSKAVTFSDTLRKELDLLMNIAKVKECTLLSYTGYFPDLMAFKSVRVRLGGSPKAATLIYGGNQSSGQRALRYAGHVLMLGADASDIKKKAVPFIRVAAKAANSLQQVVDTYKEEE